MSDQRDTERKNSERDKVRLKNQEVDLEKQLSRDNSRTSDITYLHSAGLTCQFIRLNSINQSTNKTTTTTFGGEVYKVVTKLIENVKFSRKSHKA